MSDQITLSVKRYNELIHAEKILAALRAAGVDNWEWYDEALSELSEEEEND